MLQIGTDSGHVSYHAVFCSEGLAILLFHTSRAILGLL